MELGYITPPVGMNLFLSAYRIGKPVPMVMRSVIPMFLVLLLGVLLITYIHSADYDASRLVSIAGLDAVAPPSDPRVRVRMGARVIPFPEGEVRLVLAYP